MPEDKIFNEWEISDSNSFFYSLNQESFEDTIK